MFMVTAPSPIQHLGRFCGQQASTSRQHQHQHQHTQFANECDEVAAMAPKLSTASNCSTSSAASGGLRRTVSSLQSAKPHCLLAKPGAGDLAGSAPSTGGGCVVEAKQVEMDFATLTSRPFYLTVRAPNGEQSDRMHFPGYGRTHHFSPLRDGCGHGHWELVVETRQDTALGLSSRLRVESRERLYLDGVGTLFFTVDDQLHVKLASQEFLRLPSASQCCSRKPRKL